MGDGRGASTGNGPTYSNGPGRPGTIGALIKTHWWDLV